MDNPMVRTDVVSFAPRINWDELDDECGCVECGDELDPEETYDDGDGNICKHCLLDKYLVC